MSIIGEFAFRSALSGLTAGQHGANRLNLFKCRWSNYNHRDSRRSSAVALRGRVREGVFPSKLETALIDPDRVAQRRADLHVQDQGGETVQWRFLAVEDHQTGAVLGGDLRKTGGGIDHQG